MAAEHKELPPLPDQLTNVWEAFTKLDAARSSGFGPNPISYSEIAAFIYTTDTPLSGWDVELIKRLDLRVLLVKAGKVDPTTIDGAPPKKPGVGSFLREKMGLGRKGG